MKNIGKKHQDYPKTYPKKEVVFTINMGKKNYSLPKLYIPKGPDGRATLEKDWYVWFNFRNPETGKFDNRSKVKRRHGINRYKSISLRKKWGNKLKETYTLMLKEGYNPFKNRMENDHTIFQADHATVTEAFAKALEDRRNVWEESTYRNAVSRVNSFLEFANEFHFAHIPSSELNRRHFSKFLNGLKENGRSPRTVNNYRTDLGMVLSQMVENDHIGYNFVKDIKKEKTRPIKNHPFTEEQANDIRDYLLVHNPNLLRFLRIMAYSFLRNREVLRLTIGDIDLKNRLFTVKTKARALEKVFIVDPVLEILEGMEIHKYRKSDCLVSLSGEPGEWDVKLSSKTGLIGDRFEPVKKHFGFGPEYSIYSFRHTVAISIYKNLRSGGMSDEEAFAKLQPMMRHATIEMTKNYVREKMAMLPRDYSSSIVLEF